MCMHVTTGGDQAATNGVYAMLRAHCPCFIPSCGPAGAIWDRTACTAPADTAGLGVVEPAV
jgi:hypothetical protein